MRIKSNLLGCGIIVGVTALLTGCITTEARYKLNRPLDGTAVIQKAPTQYKQPDGKAPQPRSDDTLFMLSFSGGGTRAAALSYGVLQELRDTRAKVGVNGQQRRLIDEVDYISSVSGGSFTAAYFGLFGDEIFQDFEQLFLRKDIEREIASWLTSVDMVKKIFSPYFGRTDGVAEYYHHAIFKKAGLNELIDKNGPYIEINAADLGRGARFGFSVGQLRLICTDPQSISVARAVAASSAVPVLFSPVALRNYAGECPGNVPDWVNEGMKQKATDARRYREARLFMSYLVPGKRKFIHLLDGGLVDNLGVRASITRSIQAGSLEKSLAQRGKSGTKKIVFIVVDAATKSAAKWDEQPGQPPTEVVVSDATSMPLEQINFETLELLRSQMQAWKDAGSNRDFHVIYLGFDSLSDAERQDMQNIPTSFTLGQPQVDQLIEVGHRLLRNNKEYRRWLDAVD